MRVSWADAGRAAVSTLIAALCGAIVWFAGYSAELVDASALWALVLLVGVVGLGCGIGHLLVRRDPAVPRRATGWLAWSACAVAAALPFGALLGAVYAQHMSISPLGFLALAAAEALVAGLLIGHSAALQTHFGGAVRALAAVAAGLLHGYAFGLAYGAAWLALYRPACPPHGYCLEPGPLLGIHSGLIVGPIAGLALGIIAALALTAAYSARRLPARSRRAAAT